ncbi:MAG: ABC transporter permease [Desulfovibrio sp.]|uniref:ABC transporter permease n=1 Tax=Desulfovibrio sp. 7SRBS1 TaxID=3378064 RepID=UPI003B41683A
MNSALPVPLRLARREMRTGLGRFGVFLACLALGVGLISAVGSLSASVESGIRRDAKSLLGGDLSVSRPFLPIKNDELDFLRSQGRVSHIATMRAMAFAMNDSGTAEEQAAPNSSTDAPADTPDSSNLPGKTALTEIKAVDKAYPLAGTVLLTPDMSLAQALAPLAPRQNSDTTVYGAAVDPALSDKLGLPKNPVGRSIRVGNAIFRINALIRREPDRSASLFTLGPRLLITLDALNATGLVMPGSLVRHWARLDMPHTAGSQSPDVLAKELENRFPTAGWRVRTFTQASPRVRTFTERMNTFLTFVGLAALLIAGVGMGRGVDSYLRSKMQHIAVMKCLGSSTATVFAAYLSQVMAIALVGSLLGAIIGGTAPIFAASAIQAFFPSMDASLHLLPMLQAVGFGLATALAFSLPPLTRAAHTSPAQLFRGYTDHTRPTPANALSGQTTFWERQWKNPRAARLFSIACGVVLLTGYALLVTPSARLTLWFCLASAASMLVFTLSGQGLRRVSRIFRPKGSPRLALALRSLDRPGSSAVRVMLALGLGLTALVAVNLVTSNFHREVAVGMAERTPSYFFIDIQNNQVVPFRQTVLAVPGVTDIEQSPMIRGRIMRIKGKPAVVEDIPPSHRWVLRGDRGLTYAADVPPNSRVVAGKWWPKDYSGPPLISLTRDIAEALGIGLGDTLTINILGRETTAPVVNYREVQWDSLRMNFSIVFAPGFLEDAPLSHIAAVYADPKAEAPLLEKVSRQFPNVSSINMREVLNTVTSVLGNISLAVRLIAYTALFAGVLVLSGSLRAGLESRLRDAAVMRVLGASPMDVLLSLVYENLLLGAAAAITATILGTLAAWGIISGMLGATFHPLPAVTLPTALAGMALTLATGMAGMFRVLRRKPMAALRNE